MEGDKVIIRDLYTPESALQAARVAFAFDYKTLACTPIWSYPSCLRKEACHATEADCPQVE